MFATGITTGRNPSVRNVRTGVLKVARKMEHANLVNELIIIQKIILNEPAGGYPLGYNITNPFRLRWIGDELHGQKIHCSKSLIAQLTSSYFKRIFEWV